MGTIDNTTLIEIRLANIEETNLKTGITAILENNELSTKEKVDSLIEYIEIEAQTERIEDLEELTDELEDKVDNLKDEITKLKNQIKTLEEEKQLLQEELDER